MGSILLFRLLGLSDSCSPKSPEHLASLTTLGYSFVSFFCCQEASDTVSYLEILSGLMWGGKRKLE